MTNVALPVLDHAAGASASSAALARALTRRTDAEVRFGRHDRLLYATDASIYQVEPIGVVIPRTVGDVVEAVKVCAEHEVPVVPRGGGTSLAGQAVNRAVVIDASPHLNAIVAVDAAARRARVQPGVVLERLNERLAALPRPLAFGPDVATAGHATIGGMIGNNSAGARSLLYGRTVEHVVGLDAVLADGERLWLGAGSAERDPRAAELTRRVAAVVDPLAETIAARYPRIRRRVNGYNLDLILAQLRASTPGTYDAVNLAHLLCGAEGTLALTVGAELALVDAPRERGLVIVAFEDVDAALANVNPILETKPAAVELVDDVILDLAARNLETQRYVGLLPSAGGARAGAVLYVEYFADDRIELAASLDALAARYGAAATRRYTDAASMADAWALRKSGEPLLHGRPGLRKPITFVEDLAVAPSRLPEFVKRLRALLADHGTTASFYAHASVGCLHVRPMICLTDPADVEAMERIMEEATDLVLEFEGALSGEHGDGRLRSHLLERFYGKEIVEGFRAIKAVFDPDGRLNPGIIVDPRPMVECLRVRPAERTVHVPAVETYFRYEREHGFAEAVERCNGAGVCRKTKGGTMCPSYRATRDERHATRGRGNALRLAISGQLTDPGGPDEPAPAWNDPETLATLDLCLSNGRLISAIWDDWESLADQDDLEEGDLFTLRRIDDMFYREVPRK